MGDSHRAVSSGCEAGKRVVTVAEAISRARKHVVVLSAAPSGMLEGVIGLSEITDYPIATTFWNTSGISARQFFHSVLTGPQAAADYASDGFWATFKMMWLFFLLSRMRLRRQSLRDSVY